jgi:hypothetical protein
MQTRAAQSILKQATAGLNKDSGQAAFQAASVVAAKGLAEAGIPVDMARSLMTKGALDGAIANGYGPGGPNSTVMGFSIWGKVQSTIADGVNAALQGYNPGASGATPQGGRYGPGPVQGPYGFQPDAPGRQGALPFGQQYADLSQSIGRVAPSGMTGRPGEIGAQQPMFSIPGLDRLSPIIAPPVPPNQPANPREQASLFDTRFLAKGGHVDKDEPVVVGEEGPETFVPDTAGMVFPHMPQPGKGKNVDHWPKVPAPEYPGRYGGIERELLRRRRRRPDF